jgi:hypothetical protein
VASSCEYGDEPSGSDTLELVSYMKSKVLMALNMLKKC